MKIYRIAQFNRGDQLAQRRYDKHMDEVLRRDIIVTVLKYLKQQVHPKVEVITRYNKESFLVELIVRIMPTGSWKGSSSQKILEENVSNIKSEISNICGISPTLEVWGSRTMSPKKEPVVIPESEYSKIKQMYFNGEKMDYLASLYNVSLSTIYKIIHKE